LPVIVDLDVDHIRSAADGTIFDILLAFAGREVDRDDNLLATRITDVAGLVIHN
jgi:hypothetical protein